MLCGHNGLEGERWRGQSDDKSGSVRRVWEGGGGIEKGGFFFAGFSSLYSLGITPSSSYSSVDRAAIDTYRNDVLKR